MSSKFNYSKPAFILSFLSFLIFCFLAYGVQINANWVNWLDQVIAEPIIASSNQYLTPFVIFITDLGGVLIMSILVLLFSFLILWYTKNKRIVVWYFFQFVLGAGVLNYLAKLLFQRERPTIEHLVVQGGLSFPSGHSMGSFICYGGITFLFFYLHKKKKLPLFVFIFATLLILSIGFSRIYLGVHFPLDVIGGYLLGASWLALMIGLFPYFVKSSFNKKKDAVV